MPEPQPPIDTLEARLIADGHAMRRIFFRDLVVEIPIGVHKSELGGAQRVAVNLSLYVRTDGDAGDDFRKIFDYDLIRRGILKLAQERHTNLQETLVEKIADMCLAFEPVLGVRASTQKLDVYPNCAGVGVEIVRLKG